MKKCGKSRCQICKFVKEGRIVGNGLGNREHYTNYDFDCDSAGIVYLIECKKSAKQYIGSTITSFRKRFTNHKSSLFRYGRDQRGIPGKHLYAQFFGEDHHGLDNIMVSIIDKTDISKPVE